MLNYDLKMIKDKYGENMMRLCRMLFPSLLEYEGLLYKTLSEHFEFNKDLYDDLIKNKDNSSIEDFKNYIYGLIDVETLTKVDKDKTPKELLEEAGYDLYECKAEEDIQSFKKYYARGEELCTFHGHRLDFCHVFFAVKKNVDDIKREDFTSPSREDEYGTSVISIQFYKGDINTLSIKNRYNHSVNNPDATFGNNLDNITPGLTTAFEKEYGFNVHYNPHKFYLRDYVLAPDGKYYKYNYEINGIYYCPNNVVIDYNDVKKYDKDKYLIVDYYIIDKVNKTIELYDKSIPDSFPSSFGKIDRIEELVDKSTGERTIVINNSIKIVVNKQGKIIKYTNNNIEKIDNGFMMCNDSLSEINIPNIKMIGNEFLRDNNELKSFVAKDLIQVGDSFMSRNTVLTNLEVPNLEIVGSEFLIINRSLESISMPKLCEAGDYFINNNLNFEVADFPELKKVGDNFLSSSPITVLNTPKLEEVGSTFLTHSKMSSLELDSLRKIGNSFMGLNESLESLSLPNVESIGTEFLLFNGNLGYLNLPKVKTIGRNFLQDNNWLHELYLPELESFDSKGSLYHHSTGLFGDYHTITIYVPKYTGDEFDKIASPILKVVKGEKPSEEIDTKKNRGL